jgi:hypothetical protein
MAWHGKERHGWQAKARQGMGKARHDGMKRKKRQGKERLGIDHILCCGCPIHLASCTFIHGVGYLGIHTCGVVACMHILGGNIPCGHLEFELD